MATVHTLFKFNNATGSDTAASGCGPTTALSGTNASFSGTGNAAVVTLDGSPDLSGVATDKSHVLLLKTAGAGYKYFMISAKDNVAKTVTLEAGSGWPDATAAASPTGLTWAIGGKRKTLEHADSRILGTQGMYWAGYGAMIIELEDDQTLTSPFSLRGWSGQRTLNGQMIMRGNSTTSHRKITQTTDAACITPSSGQMMLFQNLKLENTSVTKTDAVGITTDVVDPNAPAYTLSRGFDQITLRNIIFGDATNQLSRGIQNTAPIAASTQKLWIINCEIAYCTDAGIIYNPTAGMFGTPRMSVKYSNCWIHDNGAAGVLAMIEDTLHDFYACLINNNADAGIDMRTPYWGNIYINQCTIDGNGGNGLHIQDPISGWSGPGGNNTGSQITNSNFTNNGAYGINDGDGSIALTRAVEEEGNFGIVDNNNFGAGATTNTSGAIRAVSVSANSLQVDPGYSGNWLSGTSVRAKGYPLSHVIGAGQGTTPMFNDIGTAKRQENIPRLINGGSIS